MTKKLFFILSFISIFQLSFSQNLVFDKSNSSSSSISYSSSGELYNNQIIKTIASGNSQSTASITVSYSSKLQILKQTYDNTLNVYIQVNSVSGDTEYRNFSVEKTLVPSKVSFTLNYLVDNEISQTYNFTNVSVTNLSNPTGTKTVSTSSETYRTTEDKNYNYSIEITDVKFLFDNYNKSNFDNKVKSIEKYYTSSDLIKTSLSGLDGIIIDEDVLSNLDDLEKIVDYKALAKNNIQLCKTTKSESFYSDLDISYNDPDNLKDNIDLLSTKSTELYTISDELIDKFDELYYEKGIAQVNSNNTQMAQFYFNKSISYNKNYSPSHYQIAKINYDNDNSEGALEILEKIYKMNPDSKTLSSTNDLVTKIYSNYVDNAISQNVRKNYDKSLEWLTEASEICYENKYVECSAAMETAYQTAHLGKYSEYLDKIDQAYNSGRLTLAETSLETASNYQKSNSKYITDNSEIVSRHQLIYDKYVLNADNFMSSKKYEEALLNFLNAQRICTENSYLSCNEDLTTKIINARTGIYTVKIDDAEDAYAASKLDYAEQLIDEAVDYQETYSLIVDDRIEPLIIKIKQIRYDSAISSGLTYVSGQNFTSALTKFDFAKDLEVNYSISINSKLETYINSSAKSLILQKLEEGEKKVNINDLTSARELYQEAIAIQSKYEINSDEEVKIAMINLNEMIFQQECLNYKAEYDKYYQEAVNFIFDADYISADDKLQLAIDVVENHSECMLDATNAKDKKYDIEAAVIYQNAMKTAKSEISKKNYQTGIEKYLKAQVFFADYNIENEFSLTHVDFYTFISESDNEFVNYGVKYYTTEGEYEKAFYLLTVLNKKGYSKKLTKENQINLGNQTAIRDHFNNSSADLKTQISSYTNADSYYKYFAKAFKKKWKNL